MSLQRLLFYICCLVVFATFCLNMQRTLPEQYSESFDQGYLCCMDVGDLDFKNDAVSIGGSVVNNPGYTLAISCRFFDDAGVCLDEKRAIVSEDGSFSVTMRLSQESEVVAASVSLELPGHPTIVEWSLPKK